MVTWNVIGLNIVQQWREMELDRRGHLRKIWWDGGGEDMKRFGLSQDDAQEWNKWRRTVKRSANPGSSGKCCVRVCATVKWVCYKSIRSGAVKCFALGVL